MFLLFIVNKNRITYINVKIIGIITIFMKENLKMVKDMVKEYISLKMNFVI
jgi:hypothetical protein